MSIGRHLGVCLWHDEAMSGEGATNYRLARHVPRIALDWIADTPEQRWKLVPGPIAGPAH